LYPNIDCQVRILHGAEDQVIEPEQARDLHRAMRRSELRLIQNAGHMVTHADPGGVAAAVNSLSEGAKSLRSVG